MRKILGLLLLTLISVVALKKKIFKLWGDKELEKILLSENRPTRSYLFQDEYQQRNQENRGNKEDISVSLVQDIVEIIYQKQNPPKDSCSKRRLLIAQMSSTSFEGTGSLMKQAQLSLAIALHSNRTLIWGLGFPFMFEHSKEIWAGPEYNNVQINNEILDCSQDDPAAGAMGCFFEPLSTCSLEDIPPGEMIQFSHNAYNHSSRVMLSEVSKGVALYHPPQGLFDYIWAVKGYSPSLRSEFRSREAHIFAAAVTAYIFRIKKPLVESFYKKFQHIFHESENRKPIWGLHVRHGDLKALSNVYSYKEIFDFEDYFSAAIAMSYNLKYSPSKIFVATDSVEADQIPKIFQKFLERQKKIKEKRATSLQKNKNICKDETCSASTTKSTTSAKKSRSVKSKHRDEDDDDDYFNDDEEEDDDEDDDDDDNDDDDDDEDDEDDEDEDEDEFLPSTGKRYAYQAAAFTEFYGNRLPSITSISNNDRYRTEHGSHTVAANGGCLRDEKYNDKGMRCSLNYEAILQYQSMEEHRSVPRSYRLMRVLLESIEDLYLLSRCDALIAQGSSHFSTLASLLIWARTGAKNMMNTVRYLDIESIEQGFTPTAFLHGMNLLNGTNGIDKREFEKGSQRWQVHTNAFISGLPNAEFDNGIKLPFNPWGPESRMKLLGNLPHLPEKVFNLEVKTWLATKESDYKPTFPGMCPGKMKRNEDPLQYLTSVINLGVEHLSASHPSQAIQCWHDALQVIEEFPNADTPARMKEYKEVAAGNAATMRIMRYAEMVINENRNTHEYLSYYNKYMTKPYDGVDHGIIKSGGSKRKTIEGKEVYSLEEVNEEIVRLEKELSTLKNLRDKLIEASYMMINGQLPLAK